MEKKKKKKKKKKKSADNGEYLLSRNVLMNTCFMKEMCWTWSSLSGLLQYEPDTITGSGSLNDKMHEHRKLLHLTRIIAELNTFFGVF